jgi:hypothetical protein
MIRWSYWDIVVYDRDTDGRERQICSSIDNGGTSIAMQLRQGQYVVVVKIRCLDSDFPLTEYERIVCPDQNHYYSAFSVSFSEDINPICELSTDIKGTHGPTIEKGNGLYRSEDTIELATRLVVELGLKENRIVLRRPILTFKHNDGQSETEFIFNKVTLDFKVNGV